MSCYFVSCIFMSCHLVRHFHVLLFHALQIGPSISCPSFSRPAFSAPPSSLSVPIRSRREFMKLSEVKISSRIIGCSANKFLILKHFDRHCKLILFIVTIFVASCQTGGAKAKTRGAIVALLQRRTTADLKIIY